MGQMSLDQLRDLLARVPHDLATLLATITEGISPATRRVREQVALFAESVERFENTDCDHGTITGTFRPHPPLLVVRDCGVSIDWISHAIQQRSPDRESIFFFHAGNALRSRAETFDDASQAKHLAWALTERHLRRADQRVLVFPQLSSLSLADQELLNVCLQGGSIHQRDEKRNPVWPPDVVVIAVETSEGLEKMVQGRRLLGDLLQRLQVFPPAIIPPLRERPEEIIFRVQEVLMSRGCKLGMNGVNIQANFSEEALLCLVNYPWTGNDEQLFLAVERLVFRKLWPQPSYVVSPADVEAVLDLEKTAARMPPCEIPVPPAEHGESAGWPWKTDFPHEGLNSAVANLKKAAGLEALRRTRGEKKAAARLLGINRHTLERIVGHV